MAKSAFNDLTFQELTAKDRELRQELFNLRLQKATARLEKPHMIHDLRKEIARAQTRLTELRTKYKQEKQVKAAAPKA
jgi:large subunit ribosomal protein L29